ncbi:MAG: MBL fold metallo-hydrolase, partial [Spirochaetales bacterium]|nr:MBL fold metallo-hydrolase [Spirochaetales bacterium]
MLITVLGSGTSYGVPTINCNCPVCLSNDSHDKRTRASIWIKTNNTSVIIDTATDFRTQALREKIPNIDALLVTHCHADHIHGLDDIRPYSFEKPIPVYGNKWTIKEIHSRFSYIFQATQKGGGKPQIQLNTINNENQNSIITIGDLNFIPIPLKHGKLDVLGYRVGNFAYLTDCNKIPEESYELLKGIKYLIIDALRYRQHPTHFSFAEAMEESKKIGAEKTWFTHLCHDALHKKLEQELPYGFYPAFDGLKI